MKKLYIIFLILSVFIIAYFYSNFALITLVAITGIITEIDGWLKKELGLVWKRILVFGLITAIAFGNITQYFINKTESEFKQGTCTINVSTDKETGMLYFGGITETFSTSSPAINIFGKDEISVKLKNNKIEISDVIRNATGEVLAYVVDNVFQVQKQGLEFNCDENAVEVKDSKGNIVQQIIVANGDVTIYGINFIEYNKFMCWTKDGSYGPFDPKHINGSEKCFTLKPIFKYPQTIYRGIRAS